MRSFVRNNIQKIEWTLGILAVVLPVVAWLSRADLADLTLYDIFPPLGLIAFGVMWTHFVMGSLRRYANLTTRSASLYGPISMGLVLALIILHPGLLWLALFLDGYGLPPQSYMQAYSAQLGFLALGTTGLLIFLAYELKRWFGDRRWWKYVERLQVVAMIAIFIHALGLGNEVRIDWFMAVWLFYGITLAASVVYSAILDKNKEKTNEG